MSRILKRPMFRIGGSATGITSGLDTPKRGLVDGPGKYSQDDVFSVIPTAEELQRFKTMYPEYGRPQGEGLSRCLTSFGLDLLSRPPQGGFLSTVAQAAKGPTEQLFKDLDTERATKFATDADMFKTLIEAKGEAVGSTTGGKTYAKLQIANDIENTMSRITDLKARKDKGEDVSEELAKAEARLEYLSKGNPTGQALMQQTDFTEKVLKSIMKTLQAEMIDDPNNPGQKIPKYAQGKSDPELLQEAYRQFYEFFQTVPDRESDADGGRAGYQMGGESKPMANQPMTMNQGTAEEPKIDFATLRARLPKEIGDDIVRLISQSPEALEDFATIATQQDVDLFNQKYSVNLVLPQEA